MTASRLNLNLRCASQVLYSIKHFEAQNADDIYKNLDAYPWETILPDNGYFSVTSNVLNPTINNSMFANLRVKDAIVDRLREKTGTRPSTGAELTGAVIHLFWKNENAEIFVDTSGDSLARHGYRKIPGRAPMLEALAAAPTRHPLGQEIPVRKPDVWLWYSGYRGSVDSHEYPPWFSGLTMHSCTLLVITRRCTTKKWNCWTNK